MNAIRKLSSLAIALLVAGPAVAQAYSITVTARIAAYQDTLVPAVGRVVPAAGSADTFSDEALTTVSAFACASGSTADCVKYAAADAVVVLEPAPQANTVFVGWSGCNSVAGTACTVQVTANRAVTASFKPATYAVTVRTSPAPVGTYVPAYGGTLTVLGTDYRSTLADPSFVVSVPAGVATVLTATPDAGSAVKGWGGCTPGTPNTTCTATVWAPTAISVGFNVAATNAIRAAVVGNGAIRSGTVATDPDYMSCRATSGDCTAVAPVTLTAVADAGFTFKGWTGPCTGTGTTCAVSGSAFVTATFKSSSCSACHGLPPGAPHVADAACGDCHLGYTVGTVNAALHMNGARDVAGHATAPRFLQTQSATTGPQVTAACVGCHPTQANDLLASTHFTWMGNSTMVNQTGLGKRNLVNNFCVANASNEARCLQCHPSYSSPPTKDPATGAVAVNTGPMYLWAANAAVDKTKIDCIICHANLGTSRYVKAAAPFGAPWLSTPQSCAPSCAANQICSNTDSTGAVWTDGLNHCRAPNTLTEVTPALQAAAASVGAPQRSNCGFCHFNAGGGDNVKMGDLGTALRAPTPEVDVHMGSAASYAPTRCADCHLSANHEISGTGLSIPVDDEGRLTCTDCHSGIHAPAHANPQYDAHADFIACQTCHIPTFSRTQYTKMNWDWSRAVDKAGCQGLTGCVPFGSLTYPAGNAQTGTIAGVGGEAPKDQNHVTATVAQGYDWKKGVSTYEQNVTPAYRFIAPAGTQQGTHETISRNGLAGSGTEADPFMLADLLPPPAPVLAGWKIAPFKKMTGRSPAFADDSAMVVPHVFGMDSLWQTDLRGFPVVANNLGSATNPWDQAKADAVWTGALNYGAAVGGQLGAAPVAKAASGQMTRDASHLVTVNTVADLPEPLPARLYLVGAQAAFPSGVKAVTKTGARQFTYTEAIPYTVATGQPALPALPATSGAFVAFYPELAATDWKWAYTAMFINLNHEVSPVATAVLTCSSCHPSMGGTIETSRMKELYDLSAGGCTDPMNCLKR